MYPARSAALQKPCPIQRVASASLFLGDQPACPFAIFVAPDEQLASRREDPGRLKRLCPQRRRVFRRYVMRSDQLLHHRADPISRHRRRGRAGISVRGRCICCGQPFDRIVHKAVHLYSLACCRSVNDFPLHDLLPPRCVCNLAT